MRGANPCGEPRLRGPTGSPNVAHCIMIAVRRGLIAVRQPCRAPSVRSAAPAAILQPSASRLTCVDNNNTHTTTSTHAQPQRAPEISPPSRVPVASLPAQMRRCASLPALLASSIVRTVLFAYRPCSSPLSLALVASLPFAMRQRARASDYRQKRTTAHKKKALPFGNAFF